MTDDPSTTRGIASPRALVLAVLILTSVTVVALAAAPAAAAAGSADALDTPGQTPEIEADGHTAPHAAASPGLLADTDDSDDDLNETDENGDGDGEDGADELEYNETRDGPDDGSQVRINPDMPDVDYVSASVEESDRAFASEGNFVTFSLTHGVESARVEQPGAEATVLGDGTVVRVDFDEDAARGNSTTLFMLELFFPDGSTHEVDIFASHTAISAETEISPEYESFIETVQDMAEDEGYGDDPDALVNYVEDLEERAEMWEGLWSESVQMFVSLRIAQFFSPFDWAIGILGAALLALYMNRRYGWVSRAMNLDLPKSRLIREAVRQEHEKNRNRAAKHRLEDVDTIGHNASRYWRSELGIETVDDMVQAACKGIVAMDGNGRILTDDKGNDILLHHGVDDLDIDPITHQTLRENTWLKPLLIEGRLTASTALSNISAALHTAETEYGLAGQVRDDRMHTEELIRELKGDSVHEDASSSTFAPRPHETPTDHATPASSDDHAPAGPGPDPQGGD